MEEKKVQDGNFVKETGEGLPPVKAKTAIEMPIPLVQEIINYLQTRPYGEVFQLIGKIMEAAK